MICSRTAGDILAGMWHILSTCGRVPGTHVGDRRHVMSCRVPRQA
ncbi:hypothetical protein [Nigerium massiliense]|nr:hypothetical protein [Nigerium massiliense]